VASDNCFVVCLLVGAGVQREIDFEIRCDLTDKVALSNA
jgi:hypothetical protein